MKNLRIVQKAYELVLPKLDGEWRFFSDAVVNTNNRNEAKSMILNKVKYDGHSIDSMPLSYLNIPIRRCKEADLVVFEGSVIRRNQIDEFTWKKKKAIEHKKILDDNSISKCYIMKRGLLYRPGSCGYTEYKHEAGVYDKEYAVSHAGLSDEIFVIPVDIEFHNTTILNKIKELENNLTN